MALCAPVGEPAPRQDFLTVRGLGEGAHPLTTVGQIKLAAHPHLCVARVGDRVENDHNYIPSHSLFVLKKCDGIPERLHFEFELIVP